MARSGYSREEVTWAIVVTLGIVVVFSIIGMLHYRHEAQEQRIVATTPALTTEAVVTNMVAHKHFEKRKNWGDRRYELTFQVQGQEATLFSSDGVKFSATNVGSLVTVTYHQGETGERVVVDWQPKINAFRR